MTALPGQLELPLAFAPAPVRAHGLRAAHPRPLVSPGKRLGQPFTSFRTSPQKAWRFPEVEYANAGSSIAAIVLDCDQPARIRRGLPDLPTRSWTVWRPANSHAHVCWTLAKPVHRYPAARVEPLRFLTRIAEYYAHAVGADPGYAGVLAHNPVSIYRSPYKTTWGRRRPVLPRPVGERLTVRMGAADRSADRCGPQRRSVRGRHEVGRPVGQRRPAGATGAHGGQPGLRPPAAAV